MVIETHPRRIPHLRARNLRHDQTDAEAQLWARMRGGQLEGLKFRRQFPVGQFIADFCCPQRRLIIELDGGQHAEQLPLMSGAQNFWVSVATASLGSGMTRC